MRLKRPIRGIYGSTILACLVGFAASLVPFLSYSDPFWGVSSFSDKEMFAMGDSPGVVLLQIESGSPAAFAGLRAQDHVLEINGRRAEFASFRETLERMKPGEPIAFVVKRGGQDLQLAYNGEIPKLEGVLMLDWQFVSAPVFLALMLLLIATQPLEPPLWRAIVVVLSGLAIIAAAIIAETTQFFPWSILWRTRAISNGPSPALHYPLLAIVLLMALAISIFGAFAIRGVLMRRKSAASISAS